MPIAASHDHILAAVEENQVIIIRGETGSGKTTQVRNCKLTNNGLNCGFMLTVQLVKFWTVPLCYG